MSNEPQVQQEAVAIVGVAGRFPRARDVREFWRNLRDGIDCVSFFADDQVQWLPIEHPPVLSDPRYVKARAVLEKPEWFDAAFFGVKPREAAIMDPQHRVFLECAWEALEDAGCDPEAFPGLIGVFAGASMNTYLFTNLLSNPELVKDYGLFSSMILNDGDFVPTRVSYKLNLRGPSINVQTACSTSLVAVCLAAQSLLTYRCDVALAGGVSITFPPNRGQHHLEGGILSNDGHCRAFDAKASGTVLGDGAGIVVLKRLSEAVADGDRIYAVIKGTAINNDGSAKIGYTAPSINGQAECIAMAQAEAGVEPETISYVEAHGTGTPLGDPIEIAGLTKAFGIKPGAEGTVAKSCAVGSVKSNIGHLDIAAGVAGLIKTVLALQHGEIPPSLHFETPNPKLDIEATPFVVNRTLRPWPRTSTARRAGVSSFGIGGTNAHLVLEEAPLPAAVAPSRRLQHLLVVSARTPSALDAASANLAAHLQSNPQQALADVAYSLQTRRRAFPHRRALVADSRDAAIAALRAAAGEARPEPQPIGTPGAAARLARGFADIAPGVVFMFPGQGAQAVNMGRELYETEPRFRSTVDRCCRMLQPHLGLDLRELLFAAEATSAGGQDGRAADASHQDDLAQRAKLLGQTRYTQPALFVIEYALAELWMFLGVRPEVMIGHSLGEYVAACLAGVFSLEDALAIVAERARLMQAQPEGAMLAVRVPEAQIAAFLNPSLSLAATNARELCVVSGPFDAITALEKKLGESGVASRRLATSHAFHSAMMEGAARPLASFIRRFERRPPQIAFVSNVTGQRITPEQAMDPEYWARHLRQTVRFAEGVASLMDTATKRIFLEVGPGETLTGLTRHCVPPTFDAAAAGSLVVASSLGRSKPGASERAAWLHAVGQLWAGGLSVNWPRVYDGEVRRFVTLPTYPFERQRYWIEPGIDFRSVSGPSARTPADAVRAHATDEPSVSRAFAEEPESRADTAARAGAPQAAEPRQKPLSTLDSLRAVFGQLSGLDLAGVNGAETFYELGFDSLFLTQASQAVSRQFGVDVTFRQLREQFQSLTKLAAHLDAARAGAVGGNAGSVQTSQGGSVSGGEPESRVLPLSEAQREIWFASQLGTEVSSSYNESSSVRLNGPLDVDALQDAFRQLLIRHEALRVTVLRDGENQQITAQADGGLQLHDVSAVEGDARERRLQELVRGELERPFDLHNGPLWRAHLVKLEAERHVLVLVVHHIICDGWSLGILQRDLGRLYAGAVGARSGTAEARVRSESASVALAPAPSFSAYALRRAAAQDSDAYRAAGEFWLRQFADEIPTFDLPADRPRPAERTYAGSFLLHTLDPDVTAALKTLCAQRQCTMFSLLLAAFDVWLHRLSGQNDIVVGIPAAAQVMDGMDDLVGHFANLLPVRTRLDDALPFTEFLRQVDSHLMTCLEHWQFPFGVLLQKLSVPRDASRMPLANVVFNSTRLRGTLPFGEVAGRVEGNAKRFSHFDLNVNFAVTDDGISIGAYYSTELFEEATLARWLGHFETLLRGIIATPDAPLFRLPLLTPAEKRHVLEDWNASTIAYPREATLAGLFEAQAARTPTATALVVGESRFTYRQLDERAGRLASRLRKAGVGRGMLVGVFLGRDAELVVAILGILKTGAAYVPLDPNYPAERLEYIAGDARMPMVVTETQRVGQLPAGGFDFLLVDDEAADATRVRPGGRPEARDAGARAGDVAYVIYTSGSTGRPKGVEVEQRGLALFIEWARSVYTPEELDGVLFSTSVCFDVSAFELFCPLCLGGKVVLAENVLQIGALPAASEVRLISTVPSAMAEVLRQGRIPASVTTITLAGELAAQSLIDALYALPHVRRVFDHYGPTETTVYSIGGLREPQGRPTIGRPLPNEQIYILDRHRQPVPIGVRGEIYIGGDKVARGYLNRPELTAERFIPNPFISERAGPKTPPASRLYRTGDLGRWLPDGRIECLGRADFQVKIRGYRIELGEIETTLAQHEAVAECAVVARRDASGIAQLVGYVVPHPGVRIDVRSLREHLQRWLPDYMVPSALVALPQWPRTLSGKIDRTRLPEPERTADSASFAAPATATEELLCEIWREVLGVARIGVHDNFFELGGHSLLAARIIARIRDTTEVEISMRHFFVNPTITAQAALVDTELLAQIEIESQAAAAAPAPGTLVTVKDQAS